MLFAFDCAVLSMLMRVFVPGAPFGISHRGLARGLAVAVAALAVEQLIASVLIAPKNPKGFNDTALLGLKLYVVGIGIQAVIVVYALALAATCHRNLQNSKGAQDPRAMMTSSQDQPSAQWRSASYALLFSLGAILTRTAYRLVELSGLLVGRFQVLAHHEVFFYTLECLPVLAALAVWVVTDARGVLDQCPSAGTSAAAYSYHAVSEGLADRESLRLSRVGNAELG